MSDSSISVSLEGGVVGAVVDALVDAEVESRPDQGEAILGDLDICSPNMAVCAVRTEGVLQQGKQVTGDEESVISCRSYCYMPRDVELEAKSRPALR